jgi:hypothetical protein
MAYVGDYYPDVDDNRCGEQECDTCGVSKALDQFFQGKNMDEPLPTCRSCTSKLPKKKSGKPRKPRKPIKWRAIYDEHLEESKAFAGVFNCKLCPPDACTYQFGKKEHLMKHHPEAVEARPELKGEIEKWKAQGCPEMGKPRCPNWEPFYAVDDDNSTVFVR